MCGLTAAARTGGSRAGAGSAARSAAGAAAPAVRRAAAAVARAPRRRPPAAATPVADALATPIAQLAEADTLDTRSRGRLLATVAAALGTSAKRAGAAAVGSGRWLTDVVLELAPAVPIRRLPALREQYGPGTREELAEAVLTAATRASAAVGAAGGAATAVHFPGPPALLTAQVLLAAETVAVVAVEVKLVAELHEVYGRGPAGGPAAATAAYLTSWARQRGIDPLAAGSLTEAGLAGVLGATTKRQLRQRLVGRTGRGLRMIVPFLAGAVAGAEINRRETRKLGEAILADLRRPAASPG